MKLVILDYENSQVRIINNCPTNWNSENIEDLEDYMFDGEHLNLNPDMCYYMHGNGIEVVNETYTPKSKNMPSKVDFSSRKEKLHEEMLQCIKKLMLSASQTILDLTQNENGEDTSYSAYIIRSLDVCEDVEEVEVMQIKLENDTLWYMAKGKEIVDEDWQNLSDDVILAISGRLNAASRTAADMSMLFAVLPLACLNILYCFTAICSGFSSSRPLKRMSTGD